jgi:methanethiol S-methyltransferase
VIKLVAVVCYLAALSGSAAFGLRLFLMGQGWTVDGPAAAWAWPVNLGWLFLFGVQHSGMAREGFKRSWLKIIPRRLERSLYAVLTGLLLLGVTLTWQPLGGSPLWAAPWWLAVLPVLGGLGLVAVNLRFDHAGLFGLRQAWETEPDAERLLVIGPYRFVRHPLMACLLVVLWAQPVMTPTLLLLSGGLTGYIIIGVVLEECDLRRRFGSAYAEYRRRVPALIPWRWPAPPAVYPALESSCQLSGPSSSTPSGH